MATQTQSNELVVNELEDNLTSTTAVSTKTKAHRAPFQEDDGGDPFTISESDEDSRGKAQTAPFTEEDEHDPFTIPESHEDSPDLSPPSLVTTPARRTQKSSAVRPRNMGYIRTYLAAILDQTNTTSTIIAQDRRSTHDMMKGNEDKVSNPKKDVVMEAEGRSSALAKGEIKDNFNSTPNIAVETEEQGSIAEVHEVQNDLTSTLVEMVSTPHRLPSLNSTLEAATNIQARSPTSPSTRLTPTSLEAQDPCPAPAPALEGTPTTEPSLAKTSKRQHSRDSMQEGPNKRHSAAPSTHQATTHQPSTPSSHLLSGPTPPAPPVPTTPQAILLTAPTPTQSSTPAPVKNGMSKPKFPKVPSDIAEKVSKAKQKERGVLSIPQGAAPINAHVTLSTTPRTAASSQVPAIPNALDPTTPHPDSVFGRGIARRMKNKNQMESVAAPGKNDPKLASQSVPLEAPKRGVATMPITPRTQLKYDAKVASQSVAFETPKKQSAAVMITTQTQRRVSVTDLQVTSMTGGTRKIWMAPVADMGTRTPSARASTADESVYPTPGKEPSAQAQVDDDGVRKLLFPKTSTTKRVWNNGGFKDVAVPALDNAEENKDPQTSKNQMIEVGDCLGAPLKRRKKGFLPVSDEEANLPEFCTAVAANEQVRAAIEKRKREKPEPSLAQRKAKLPFKVSKPPQSPSPSPGPSDNDPDPLSTKIRRTVSHVNKPLQHLPSTSLSPPQPLETQLMDNLQFIGVTAHPTHVICVLEISIHDLYSIVNYKHGGYDNVEAGDLWTLIAVGLGLPLLGTNGDAAQEVRKLYRNVLLAVSPTREGDEGANSNAAQIGDGEVDEDMMDSDGDALHLVDGAEFGSIRQLAATFYKGATTDDGQVADAEDEAKAIFLSKLGAKAIEPMQEVCGSIVDLHLLRSIVQERGGFSKVESKEIWQAVADALIFPPGDEGAGDALRAVYKKLLLPLDRGDEGNDDYLADPVPVKTETKPVEFKVPYMKFPKGLHKKFTDALVALSASSGKDIDENIDICGKSVPLFDVWVMVKHKLGGLQNIVMNDLWSQAAKLLDFDRRKKREKNAPTQIQRLWEETLCNLDLKLAPSVQQVAAAPAVPVAAGGTAQSALLPSSFRFTEAQVTRLEGVWAVNKSPSKAEKEALTAEFGVPYRSVYNWFMTRKGRRWQEQQDKKLAVKKPVAKEASANDAAPSNVNDDHYDSLSNSTSVPSALKQHRTKPNILPKKTFQPPKTAHPKAPAKCQVSTCPRPAIASKLQVRAILNALRQFADSEQGNEAATRFLGVLAGDIMAIRENGGMETGEQDEMNDDAANKNREPVKKNWPVVVGNGVAYRINQETEKAQRHNCGLEATSTIKLPSRTWSEEMMIPQDSYDHVYDDPNSTSANAEGEAMMSGALPSALVEANDGNFVPEEDLAARNGALACHMRFGGGAPPTRSPPTHDRPRSEPARPIPIVRDSGDDSHEVEEGSNHDEFMAHLKGMSSRQIREETQRQFDGYSWGTAHNGGRHRPVGDVSPRTISLDDSFVQSAFRTFSGDGDSDGGNLTAVSSSDIEMVDAAAEAPTQQDIAIIETIAPPAPAPSTATVSVEEVDLDLLNMLVNDKYGGYANVEERNLWRHIAIGLRFGDVAAGSEVAEGLRRVYRERFMPAIIPQELAQALALVVIPSTVENHRVSSNLNSLLARAKAGKSKKQAAEPEIAVADKSVVGAEAKEAKEAGTKHAPEDINLGFAIIGDAGGEKLLVHQDAIVVPERIHPVIEEPLALESKVPEKLPEPPKKKVTVMDFVTYSKGKAIVGAAGAFDAFNDDHLNPKEFAALEGLAQGEFSIEMFHVRCSLAAGEITECCKRALQDFFDGNSTFDEVIQAIGGPYGAKPVLGALLRKAAKCLKKDGRIDSRKLKALSWEVSEVDDHKADQRPDGTTPVQAGSKRRGCNWNS